jgi:hypothetical protein
MDRPDNGNDVAQEFQNEAAQSNAASTFLASTLVMPE